MAESTSYADYLRNFKRLMGALGRGLPNVMGPFGQLHQGTIADGALDAKTKELIALGIAVHAQCETCIVHHVHDAMEAGASREEIMDALGVSILMGGAPGVAHAAKAVEAMDQFSEMKK